MGFECGINIVPRYRDNWEICDLKDYLVAEAYNNWRNNPWNFEEGHYPTFEDYYMNYQCCNSKELPEEVQNIINNNLEDIANYYDKLKLDPTAIFACSLGRSFDDEVIRTIENKAASSEDFFELTQDNLRDLANMFEELASKYEPKKVEISHSYIFNDDDEIVLKEVDGIEIGLTLEDVFVYRRIPNDNETLFFSGDIDMYNVCTEFKNVCNALSHVDPKTHIIWYWRSY